MAGSKGMESKFESLRHQAEELVRQQTNDHQGGSADILELIHELRIYQAELEIQNEELQRAQNEIRDLHRESKNLYEFAPCGYLTLNPKGIITKINLTGNRLLATDRDRIIGQGLSHFISPNYEHLFYEARIKSSTTGQKQRIEIPLNKDDDLPIWVLAEIEAERSENDEVLQWRIVLLDISEKKKVERAYEKSEGKFKKMMEAISDPLYVCSPDLTIQFINPSMVKRVGRDITGEPCYRAIHGLENQCDWCPFDKIIEGEIIEEVVVSPFDNRSYRSTHMPIVNEDQTVSKISILKDIQEYLEAVAEKDKIQDQLFKSQKMESIGVMAGGIAHDFNNILSIIIGFTELALDDANKGTDQENNLQEVYTAAYRAKELVTQILTFARQVNEEIKPVKVNEIIVECMRLLRSTIPVTITLHQELKSNKSVLGNEALLHQALMNLATNAMHAMEESGGELSIKLEDIEIDEASAKNYDLSVTGNFIKIVISDTGIGIPANVIQNIFEPYYTTKAVDKGTGMGLAIVHGTIEKYGGTITVKSRVGHGTEFTILLPTTQNGHQPSVNIKSELPHGTERILFIDDELTIVKMSEKLLKKLGYSVTTQTCSVEALQLFMNNPQAFDLVITDMTMPNLTGDKLAVELIKIRRDIPIIICTGYSSTMTEETAAKIGIKAFAYKPLLKADLAKTVRKVLDG